MPKRYSRKHRNMQRLLRTTLRHPDQRARYFDIEVSGQMLAYRLKPGVVRLAYLEEVAHELIEKCRQRIREGDWLSAFWPEVALHTKIEKWGMPEYEIDEMLERVQATLASDLAARVSARREELREQVRIRGKRQSPKGSACNASDQSKPNGIPDGRQGDFAFDSPLSPPGVLKTK